MSIRAITAAAILTLTAATWGAAHAHALQPADKPGGTAPAATPAESGAKRWSGAVELPGGMKLEFVLNITGADAGTMSIPTQGLTDGKLSDVKATDTELLCTLALPGMPENAHAHFEFKIAPDGQTATGTLKQRGMEFPASIKRLAPGEKLKEPNRPQNPKPPFPYTQRDVTYSNPADGAKFSGTLTISAGDGPHAAVLLITGSGAQDRDETLLGHKPFLIIADHLSRAGIATLRVDDRGVGGSTSPKNGQETTDDFVGDALAGAAFLKTQPEVDPKRIGLLGHSEGGLIAPIAAARNPDDIAFVVLLAGTGVTGREVLGEQLLAILRASGADEESLKKAGAQQKLLIDAYTEGTPESIQKAKAALRNVMKDEMKVTGEETAEQTRMIDSATESQAKAMESPWMKYFLTLDPRPSLRKVRCPVLALNGGLDVQVIASQNIPEIARALLEGGNTNVTIRVFPGLNHLFQKAATGAPGEYQTIEETISPVALWAISDWVRMVAPAK